jgi:hypothetical protein
MQDQELINKVITVKGKEEKIQGGKPVMKIKDELGLTYTVYKTKQDGSESAAWKQMPSLEETVQIGFVEQDGEYEGKKVTYRTIRVFNKDIGQGVANHQAQTSTTLYQAKNSELKNDKFWEQQAYEKCCSLWASADIQNGVQTGHIIDNVINQGMYWKLFQAIKADGKKRFFVYSEKPSLQIPPEPINGYQESTLDELPTIQQDLDVSDIPF